MSIDVKKRDLAYNIVMMCHEGGNPQEQIHKAEEMIYAVDFNETLNTKRQNIIIPQELEKAINVLTKLAKDHKLKILKVDFKCPSKPDCDISYKWEDGKIMVTQEFSLNEVYSVTYE